ncbi:hypothetical protein CAPTEDRAFT_228962 [Capitella teleta]|uniref:Sulfatase N-terminal domain-containing protein n=1 Tax=Capitella teleta TaxID=283909 RepID=R7TJN7_CAPTE|nr:hypothetical protein CAPTEDRAFT_228962 [Capitella teleta]|eukprot:ELT91756.1 hypothetical protein CAPTEDRAFT_228962 [Capitella teleta]
MPEVAWTDFSELRSYKDINTQYGFGGINSTLPDDVVIDLRRAYYAAISHTDDLVGQVMQALEDEGLSDSTIVSFWGDHGWQIGEHGEWCKHTNFEIATHAPMMMHIPGITNSGVTTEVFTEFVDLFPSLAEAAGLPTIPLCPEDSRSIATCTEGKSFVALASNPTQPWKLGSFSQYPRMLIDGNLVMGYTVRTDKYRYTEWREYDGLMFTPIGDASGDVELYDHVKDPDENVNVADKAGYTEIQKDMKRILRAGWRKALPVM